MKETTVQIDGMMSVFDAAGVEKQIKRRDGVERVDANFLSGTATVVYDEKRVAADDIKAFIAECGYHCRGEVVPAHARPGSPHLSLRADVSATHRRRATNAVWNLEGTAGFPEACHAECFIEFTQCLWDDTALHRGS